MPEAVEEPTIDDQSSRDFHLKASQLADLSMSGPNEITRQTLHFVKGQWDRINTVGRTLREPQSSPVVHYLVELGLRAHDASTNKGAPLLIPPPAPKTATLTELAALIRETAETNPFVRPLADFLEGKV